MNVGYRAYAGIGSKKTPKNVCTAMTSIAAHLELAGYTMRSGAADGADQAFEKGVNSPSMKEIYLPWRSYENSHSAKTLDFLYLYPHIRKVSQDLFRRHHPAPQNCSQGMVKLLERNAFQILGEDLESPSEFVVCWTKGGRVVGGTGQALRIAIDVGIPIFNLALAEDRQRFYEKFSWGETLQPMFAAV